MRLLSTLIIINVLLNTTTARCKRPRPNPIMGALQSILSPANAERTIQMIKMASARTHGNPIESCSNPIAPYGNPFAPCGNHIPPCGNSNPPCGNSIPPCGNSIAPCGNPIAPCGNPIAPCGNPIAPCANPIVPYVNPITPCSNPSPLPIQYSPPIIPWPETPCSSPLANPFANCVASPQPLFNSLSLPQLSVQMPSPLPIQIPNPLPVNIPNPLPNNVPVHMPIPLPSPTPPQVPCPCPIQIPTQLPHPLPVHVPSQLPCSLPAQPPTQLPWPLPVQMPCPLPVQLPSQPCSTPVQIPSPMPTLSILQNLKTPEIILENPNTCPCYQELIYPAPEIPDYFWNPPAAVVIPEVLEPIPLTPAQDIYSCPIPTPAALFNPFLPAASPVSPWTQENTPSACLGTRSQYLRKIPIPPPTL